MIVYLPVQMNELPAKEKKVKKLFFSFLKIGFTEKKETKKLLASLITDEG